MDKLLKQILVEIDFTPRYLALWNQNKQLKGNAYVIQEEVFEIFEKQSLKVTFNKKERFFKYVENVEGTHFQLNSIISDITNAFVLYVHSDQHKIKSGGPFGMFAKPLDKKLKVSPKIRFNSYESLEEAISFGVKIFEEIKDNYLQRLKAK